MGEAPRCRGSGSAGDSQACIKTAVKWAHLSLRWLQALSFWAFSLKRKLCWPRGAGLPYGLLVSSCVFLLFLCGIFVFCGSSCASSRGVVWWGDPVHQRRLAILNCLTTLMQ